MKALFQVFAVSFVSAHLDGVKRELRPQGHPFLSQPPHVDQIYYEETRAMSMKLERVYRYETGDPHVHEFLNARLGLTDYWDFYYVSNLYVGKNLDKMRVIWDTGSEWLILMSGLDCSSCNIFYAYDYSEEEGLSFTQISKTIEERNYGSAQTKGFRATDTVCLYEHADACTSAFDLFIVTE